jgi:hypothetical protein
MTARRRALLICAMLPAAALPATPAAGAGAPLPSSASGRAGVVAPGGAERLLTRRTGPDTRVIATRRSDGAVLRSRRISGRWTIPAVTLGGATTGLAADGSTLLLARPAHTFPLARTELAIVDPRELVLRRRITLRGFFTVDAIAPDGRRAFLIEYAGGDPLDYRVRALATDSGRLDPHPVVDPREPDEQMGGMPMQRVLGPGGRWAYTLYGGGEETFIHALDTVAGRAACIDLEMIPADADLSAARLRVSADGRRIAVAYAGRRVATVDARTFAVAERAARPAAPPASRPPLGDGDGDEFPWSTLALGLAAVAALALSPAAFARAGARRAR